LLHSGYDTKIFMGQKGKNGEQANKLLGNFCISIPMLGCNQTGRLEKQKKKKKETLGREKRERLRTTTLERDESDL